MFGFNQKPKQQWPDTDPPGEYGGGSLCVNGTQYKKDEVEPGRWQWVLDEEIMKYKAARESRRQELYNLLTARPMTDHEMVEALGYGDNLNIREMEPFNSEQKSRELNRAMLEQTRLRLKATISGP